jgi:phosphomannomutase
LKAAIAYDCHNSDTLAKLVADVFSANGIGVFILELRPTPELSFAVKHLGCQCGIVLTAQPPEYNGYKVYWQDGQIVPPEDEAIINTIEN